jgi:ketosteroid isomerase-like protein
MRRCVLGLLVAAGLGACRAVDRADPAAVRRVIDSVNAKLEGWYAAGQIDSVAGAFAQDVWQLPPNSAPVVGRDSLRAFWTNAVKWGRWEFDLQAADVVVADSLAVERGRYTLKFTAGAQAPMPSFEDRGNYVALWRREGDGFWRIVWDAPVSELPPAGAPPAGSGSQPARPGA